ncbi:kinetochore-associated protein DSN1 homolog [Syngnathoides biaculeatus]|uniref:kinetochore-associated protein DSN1 homolog n=1 Tax=Syngnathoides biaculeatus TaxID=300417 RepID=UPI002ADDC974|nr:kinetochore-associated protein DSN1 homolog [Syngnathoides biaculeatus]
MAEAPSSTDRDGSWSGAAVEATTEVTLSPKRCQSPSAPDGVPKQKSPRIETLLPSTLDAGEGQPDVDRLQMASGSTEEPEGCSSGNRTTRRKSWRRATMTRRSLSALPNPHQNLCKNISTSLSQRERLSMLMEAAMKLATERLQNSLQSLPNSSPASFQKQVGKMKEKCSAMAKCISSEQQSQRTGELAVQKATVFQNTINRIQAESQSWEALAHKHQSKAEELERQLAQGQKKVISVDHTCIAQSSQYQLIRSKPDYRALLSRQPSMLHKITLAMDVQYKIVRELEYIQELLQSMVKEISGRLAHQAGFHDHSLHLIKDLIGALTTSASTVTLKGGEPSIGLF